MKEWDELTLQEKVESFPERHHHTFKYVLYLVIFVAQATPWEAVDKLMRNMGFEYMSVKQSSEDEAFTLSAPTYSCPDDLRPE